MSAGKELDVDPLVGNDWRHDNRLRHGRHLLPSTAYTAEVRVPRGHGGVPAGAAGQSGSADPQRHRTEDRPDVHGGVTVDIDVPSEIVSSGCQIPNSLQTPVVKYYCSIITTTCKNKLVTFSVSK